jgi:4-amino-4-deoxy-L-arabinose transferase-like glycosyltransferase
MSLAEADGPPWPAAVAPSAPSLPAPSPPAKKRPAKKRLTQKPLTQKAPAQKRSEQKSPAPRPAAPEPQPPTSPSGSGSFRDHLPGLLLIAVLTVQAMLSLRLVWANTAFLDEATYLYGGHVEIAHWLHGTPVPPYATYFSGSPVIYPPLAALAAHFGGLAAARLLSLPFMLGATALLWSITSRLFGGKAAFLAAAIFAALGPTQSLGAFATYDAMAIFLLAAATWCMVSARDRDDSTLLLLAGIALLGLANATKYATTLFDPAVVALAALTIARRRGVKPALGRAGYVAAGTLGLLSALLALGGPWYLNGVLSTTLSRATGNKPALLVLADAWKWTGVVFVLAGLGVACAVLRRHDRVQVTLLAVLAACGVLVPLDQARIHTTTSLFKQVDFGAWFAAAAAGYALTQLSGSGWRPWLRTGIAALAGGAAAALVGVFAGAQASSFFGEWPNSAQSTAVIRALVASHPGAYLAENYNVPAYYLQATVGWQRWSNTWSFTYTRPASHHVLSGAAAYRAAIGDDYFSLVILDFTATAATDSQIVADMHRAGAYHLVAVVPTRDVFGPSQVMAWAYEPAPGDRGSQHGDH